MLVTLEYRANIVRSTGLDWLGLNPTELGMLAICKVFVYLTA